MLPYTWMTSIEVALEYDIRSWGPWEEEVYTCRKTHAPRIRFSFRSRSAYHTASIRSISSQNQKQRATNHALQLSSFCQFLPSETRSPSPLHRTAHCIHGSPLTRDCKNQQPPRLHAPELHYIRPSISGPRLSSFAPFLI